MIASQKKLLRIAMKEKRALLSQEIPDAGERVASHFFAHFNLEHHQIVGAYWPIGSELDVRPLMKKLLEHGFKCALPRITPQGLEFHLWTEDLPLVKGSFHVHEPLSSDTSVFPDILLVPLLSFDKRRHRLGYGQGHFDRYLHEHPTVSIGIAFKGQEIEEVPTQAHDFALDYVLTEEGLI